MLQHCVKPGGESDPDPIIAARLCEEAGASSIVAHLREDRRHIQDRDVIGTCAKPLRPVLTEMSMKTAMAVSFGCQA